VGSSSIGLAWPAAPLPDGDMAKRMGIGADEGKGWRYGPVPTLLKAGLTSLAHFCAFGIVQAAQPQYVVGVLGRDAALVGYLAASSAAVALMCRPAIGWLGDWRGRRWLVRIGAVGTWVALLLQVLAVSATPLLASRVLLGASQAALIVGLNTITNDVSPPERRAEFFSYYSVSFFAGIGLGPLLADLLNASEPRSAFVVAAYLGLIGVVAAFTVPETYVRREEAAESRFGWRDFRTAIVPAAIPSSAVYGLAIFGFSVFSLAIPLHAAALGVSNGLAYSTYSIAVLGTRILFARLPMWLGLHLCAVLGLVALGGGLAVTGLATTTRLLLAGVAVLAAGVGLVYPALLEAIIRRVRDQERARAVSTISLFYDVAVVLGSVAMGYLADAIGYRGAFLVGGAVVGLALVAQLAVWPIHPSEAAQEAN